MDKRKESHNSHILLVKQLSKPYAFSTNDGKQVKYLDLISDEINQKKIKELDTEVNYYDYDMEEFLDENVETPFAITIKKLSEIFIKKQNLNFINKDLANIRRFFQYSVLRNKRLYTKMFPTFKPISINFDPSFFLLFAPATNKIFENKKISILINKSNEFGFVCPHEVIYYFYDKAQKSLVLNLSVNKKIVVCLNLCQEANNVDVIEVDDEIVRKINYKAFLSEKNLQSQYIVGCEKDLVRLKEDIKKQTEKIKT